MNEINELEQLEQQLADINKLIEAKKNEIIEKYCPVKMGDMVTVNNYSHRGKPMRVTHLSLVKKYWAGYAFECSGVVLKKNGTDSSFTGKSDYNSIELNEVTP